MKLEWLGLKLLLCIWNGNNYNHHHVDTIHELDQNKTETLQNIGTAKIKGATIQL